MKNKLPWILIVVGLLAGFLLRGLISPSSPDSIFPEAEAAPKFWTCSMHPQVQQPEPGNCPICFMDLIPVSESSPAGSGHAHEIHLSEHARKLAEVETAVVERRFVKSEVRLTGKVEYDETRMVTIAARVPGRLDRLFVDYTGMPVRKGDHLVELYSPELLAAQQELLQAENSDSLRSIARDKLLLYGLTAAQIDELEKSKTASDHLTLYSPFSGVVVRKNGVEGMYVQTGTPIYTIADLSNVWILLNTYESDLALLQYGQSVVISTETYPGETFTGTVTFIDPIIDERTRTAKVRINMPNPEERLKPGMFVRAVAQIRLAEQGVAETIDLAGKWICPMHPEELSGEPGLCSICEMERVDPVSLGILPTAGTRPPLVIPASAALLTGKRAVVYLETQEGVYRPQKIELGRRAGNYYIVKSGLGEGQVVVSRGAFKIDSEVQIQAKPGMMSMESGEPGTGSGKAEPQTLCPVMGNAVNKEVFTDYNGMRIYFCCAGCDTTFLENPDKYLDQMRAEGVEPEKVEQHGHE
jgi:Cu(I)/Ag(I) efflux system membrane fusion protein